MFTTLSLFFALLFGSVSGAGFTSPISEPKPITIDKDRGGTQDTRDIVRLPPVRQK